MDTETLAACEKRAIELYLSDEAKNNGRKCRKQLVEEFGEDVVTKVFSNGIGRNHIPAEKPLFILEMVNKPGWYMEWWGDGEGGPYWTQDIDKAECYTEVAAAAEIAGMREPLRMLTAPPAKPKPVLAPALWCTAYAENHGRYEAVRTHKIHVWAAVNTATGEVDMGDIRSTGDELGGLVEGYEWKRFKLIPD